MEITTATPDGTMILPAVNYRDKGECILTMFADDAPWSVEVRDDELFVDMGGMTTTISQALVINQEPLTHAEWRKAKGYTWEPADLFPKVR